jgi:hypothetical protein
MNLFEEEIKIRRTWVGVLLLISMLMSSVIIGVSLLADLRSSDYKTTIFIVVLVEGLLFMQFLIAELRVRIDAVGIGYQWFPLMLKPKRINWDLIEYAWVRKSNPLKEFGGWGIKGTKKNRAYNVSGNMGLQLIFSDKNKIFIETQNPEQLTQVLIQLASKGMKGMNQQPNE